MRPAGGTDPADLAFAGPIFNSPYLCTTELQVGCHKKVVNLTHAHLIGIRKSMGLNTHAQRWIYNLQQKYKFPKRKFGAGKEERYF
jgi:hypothetical protein